MATPIFNNGGRQQIQTQRPLVKEGLDTRFLKTIGVVAAPKAAPIRNTRDVFGPIPQSELVARKFAKVYTGKASVSVAPKNKLDPQLAAYCADIASGRIQIGH